MGRVWLAGGKRGDPTRNPSARMDEHEYRIVQARVPAVRVQLRLAQGNFHLRAGVLPVEPMVFSADARARYRLPETQPGELVPEVPNRAGQRAGGERVLLAS